MAKSKGSNRAEAVANESKDGRTSGKAKDAADRSKGGMRACDKAATKERVVWNAYLAKIFQGNAVMHQDSRFEVKERAAEGTADEVEERTDEGKKRQMESKEVGRKKKKLNAVTPSPGKGKWTDEEERLFVEGVTEYGWGSWAKISKVVKTRTNSQVNSYAVNKPQRINAGKEELGELKIPPELDKVCFSSPCFFLLVSFKCPGLTSLLSLAPHPRTPARRDPHPPPSTELLRYSR